MGVQLGRADEKKKCILRFMCGIAGVIGAKAELSSETIDRQLQILGCRGPDGNGILKDADLILIHTLLAIQDPGHATQPMSSASGNSAIVFNGEIYNFRELAREFRLENPRSASDTEVVIELYEKFGLEAMHEFEGMFAFAIFNFVSNELVLGRDKFGEKPLFFVNHEESLYFSSSPISLRELAGRNLEINSNGLLHYFKYNYIPEGSSLFEGINQVIPGTLITFQKDLSYQVNSLKKLTQSKHLGFKEIFSESVQSCLVSDVPVGLSLSGGVDSTITLCEMSKIESKVKTFTVVFDESDADYEFARKAAKIFDSKHHEIELSDAELPDLIYFVLTNQPLPFGDSSIIPAYALAKYAQKVVKVLISGDGADEILSGYDYYRKYGDNQKKSLPFVFEYLKLRCELISLEKVFGRRDYSRLNRIRDLEFILSRKSAQGLWFEDLSVLNDKEIKQLIPSKEIVKKTSRLGLTRFLGVQSVMEWDRMSYLSGDILWKSDTAGMMASIEVRTPFLNSNLVNWASQVQFSKDLSKQTLLMKEYEGQIPEEFFTRKKKGFGAPLTKWLANPKVNELFMCTVGSKKSKIYKYMDFNRCMRASEINPQTKWNLLALTLWLDKNDQ